MSLFPDWFDLSSRTVEVGHLMAVDTPDGVFRFVIGDDVIFTCVDGHVWYGAQALQMPRSRSSLNGDAALNEIVLSFFQDPAAPDLVSQIRALGVDYVRGRACSLYLQPFQNADERRAPSVAPIQLDQLEMLGLEFEMSGPLGRKIILKVGGGFEGRTRARALAYNTADHARLTGAANPSLQFVPTEVPRNEPMFP